MHGKRISMGRMKWDDVAAADVRERVKLGDICEKIKGEHWIGCKKGFLTKKKLQKKFIFSSGNKRWFVMINRYLCYFSSRKEQETGAHPKGAFADLLAVKGIDLISERTIILAFEDGENEEELVADCHDDAIAWVRAMRARMQFFKRQRKMLIRRSSSKLLDLDGDDGGAVNPRSSPPDVDSQMSSSDNWLSLFAVPAVVPNCEKNNGPTSKPCKDSGATRRQHVIAEILSTEERYVESMHILIHAYRNVAKHYCGQSGWLDSSSISIIFDQLLPLASMHEHFLEELRTIVTKRSSSSSSPSTSAFVKKVVAIAGGGGPSMSDDEQGGSENVAAVADDGADPFLGLTWSSSSKARERGIDDEEEKRQRIFDEAFNFGDDEGKKATSTTNNCSDSNLNFADLRDLAEKAIVGHFSPSNRPAPPALPPRRPSKATKPAISSLNIPNVRMSTPDRAKAIEPPVSPGIRFAAQKSAERRKMLATGTRHRRSPSEHRIESRRRESRRNSNIGFVDPVACETLEEAVGTLLGQYAHFFLMYKGYIHNFEHSQARLQNELKAKRSWASHCKEQMKVMGGISIQSLLIMPVQRLPRYRLLVKELLKSTTGDAPFRTSLEEAMGNVERALSAANEGA